MNDFPLTLSIKGKDSNFIASIQHYSSNPSHFCNMRKGNERYIDKKEKTKFLSNLEKKLLEQISKFNKVL